MQRGRKFAVNAVTMSFAGVDFKNLFICTGFSGHGAMEAPAAGLSIAEIIENGEIRTIPEVSTLNINRIRDNKLIKETIVL